MTGIDLSVVIVSWNTRDILRNCLVSLDRGIRRTSHEILLVDNASTDGSAEMVRTEFPAVRLIENTENLGFARANNIGISRARGSLILLLNPDTLVLDDAVDEMALFLKNHPETGAVCPKVLNEDGSVQSLGRTLPNLGNIAMQTVFPYRFYRLLSDFLIKIKRLGKGPVYDVDGMPGAVMMIRREVLDGIGLLDEALPLYGEDIDLCQRIKARGWKIACLSRFRIVHLGGRSTGLVPVSSQVQSFMAFYAFIRKHRSASAAAVTRGLIMVSSILRLAAWTLLGVAAGSERKRRAAIKVDAYRKIMRWSLKAVPRLRNHE